MELLNSVILIGRLTKDSELKYTPGGTAVATFTLAVDRYSKDKDKQTDFISCVAWGKTAENTAQYTEKGSVVAVDGRIQTRNYDAKDGTKRYVTEVVAEQVKFLSKKGSQAGGQNSEPFDPADCPF